MIRALAAVLALAWPVTAATEPVAPGTVFWDCGTCPELVVIPAGRFVMGTGARRPVEGPAVDVEIAQPFAIGRFEVTFDEWQACVADGGCAAIPSDHGWGRGRRPVINVTFADVSSYLDWLSAITGQPYRLPSEAEWDYANRAGTTTTWWWGDRRDGTGANCRNCQGAPRVAMTVPVGNYPPNPFGLHDTTGNVLEWVADCWLSRLGGEAPPSPPTGDWNCTNRVIRGGSWYYVAGVSRSAWRGPRDVRAESYGVGFRVARSLLSAGPSGTN